MIIRYAVSTDQGRHRGCNEDSFWMNGLTLPREARNGEHRSSGFCKGKPALFAVCDGMGGETRGDLASEAAAGSMGTLQAALAGSDPEDTARAVARLNDLVTAAAPEPSEAGHCGTTMTALWLSEDGYRTANIGDSRIYLLRGGTLTLLTHDHSMVQGLVDIGLITPEAARRHPMRSRITRWLGALPEDGLPEADVSDTAPVAPRDRFLLCSDGVCGVLGAETIARLLSGDGAPEDIALQIVHEALRSGSRDNLTAMVIFVE